MGGFLHDGGGRTTMIEQQPIHGIQGFTLNSILTEQKLAIFKKAAVGFGIGITVLNRAGEKYTHTEVDPGDSRPVTVTPYTYKGHVPEGDVYVRLNSSTRNLSLFYRRVNEITDQQNNP